MKDKEKLYERLGELLYAVALADGVIDESETDRLKEIVDNHPWGKEILWSFDYENRKRRPLKEVYEKAINHCHTYGPTEEYNEFIELLSLVADASEGIDDHEKSVISNFSHDLIERFKADLAAGINRYEQE